MAEEIKGVVEKMVGSAKGDRVEGVMGMSV